MISKLLLFHFNLMCNVCGVCKWQFFFFFSPSPRSWWRKSVSNRTWCAWCSQKNNVSSWHFYAYVRLFSKPFDLTLYFFSALLPYDQARALCVSVHCKLKGKVSFSANILYLKCPWVFWKRGSMCSQNQIWSKPHYPVLLVVRISVFVQANNRSNAKSIASWNVICAQNKMFMNYSWWYRFVNTFIFMKVVFIFQVQYVRHIINLCYTCEWTCNIVNRQHWIIYKCAVR